MELIRKTNAYFTEDGDGLRVYEHPETGQELFSVTSVQTVVNEDAAALVAWRRRDPKWADYWTRYTQIRGTLIHEQLLGKFADRPMPGYDLPSEIDKEAIIADDGEENHMISAKDFVKIEEDVERAKNMWAKIWSSEGYSFGDVQGVEVKVWRPDYGYAGTFDLLMRLNGKLTLCDLKTSKAYRPKYAEQLAAYWDAAEEMYDLEIEQACVFRLCPDQRHNPFLKPELHFVPDEREEWRAKCTKFLTEYLPNLDTSGDPEADEVQ
ncbi:PD-(D/E)XK nuclease family protein (plasmid) [Halorarum halophilum]|uniref:PD-(D/E)XK nuclease family protein n=1 Tax=Halorarum halophilum TaxID=2743090 RepID=A0A7D5KP94_9EURY|nr:PD-(D/E)XK nuclease family protein [Halobaculum halophilum]QLG30035.1 PD-(D/E)XK nuclease family protein [Halobaculum halophilum]